MTKADITSAIDSFLSIVITKAKVLLALGVIRDEIYPTPVVANGEFLEEGMITSPVNWEDYPYEMTLTKQGRVVTVSGWIRNVIGTTVPSANIMTFLGEYTPIETETARAIGTTPQGTTCRIEIGWYLGNPILRVVGNFAPNNISTSRYEFQMTYNVKD